MTWVITQTCIDVKDGGCVDVCPVDCIYEGDRMFYIQPEECVNCGLCETICPVEAIYEDVDVPPDQRHFTDINAAFFGPAVTGLGAPQGAGPVGPIGADHPAVAAHPRQTP